MVPAWLHVLSTSIVLLGFCCAGGVAIDIWNHPQRMWIMNLVWPLTALFGTLPWLWFYFRIGRLGASKTSEGAAAHLKSLPTAAAEATSHCGSGCALGDICAEWFAFTFPAVAVAFGWHTLFGEKVFAVWVLDFIVAFGFGLVFQYFTIAPMRHLEFWQGIWAALKADTLSLAAWQIGMYSFMAIANFWIFRRLFGVNLEVDAPEFWFMMQIAMIFGFMTSYPVNLWLLKAGLKEKM